LEGKVHKTCQGEARGKRGVYREKGLRKESREMIFIKTSKKGENVHKGESYKYRSTTTSKKTSDRRRLERKED